MTPKLDPTAMCTCVHTNIETNKWLIITLRIFMDPSRRECPEGPWLYQEWDVELFLFSELQISSLTSKISRQVWLAGHGEEIYPASLSCFTDFLDSIRGLRGVYNSVANGRWPSRHLTSTQFPDHNVRGVSVPCASVRDHCGIRTNPKSYPFLGCSYRSSPCLTPWCELSQPQCCWFHSFLMPFLGHPHTRICWLQSD